MSRLWGPWEVASNVPAADRQGSELGQGWLVILPWKLVIKAKVLKKKRKKEKRSLHTLNSHEETGLSLRIIMKQCY